MIRHDDYVIKDTYFAKPLHTPGELVHYRRLQYMPEESPLGLGMIIAITVQPCHPMENYSQWGYLVLWSEIPVASWLGDPGIHRLDLHSINDLEPFISRDEDLDDP